MTGKLHQLRGVRHRSCAACFEPGGGAWDNGAPNFGDGTPSYDDTAGPSYHNYGDHNFYNLCGPGAADVALWYWPLPNNNGNYTATDPWNGTKTYWTGFDTYDGVRRMRGYMVNLAWNIHASGWPSNGMMQGGQATTDSKMVDALNWEASGETRTTYFYVQEFPSGNPPLDNNFHGRVVSDILYNHVPVVVLLNARAGLPNWPNTGFTGHYVTIIGYNDDIPGGQYAYVDTCANSTGCNTYSGNLDGGTHIVWRSNMWSAITSYGEWFW